MLTALKGSESTNPLNKQFKNSDIDPDKAC